MEEFFNSLSQYNQSETIISLIESNVKIKLTFNFNS